MINSGEDYIVNPEDSVVIIPVKNQTETGKLKILRDNEMKTEIKDMKGKIFEMKNEMKFGFYILTAAFIIMFALYISNHNQLAKMISLANEMKIEIQENSNRLKGDI